MSQRLRFAAAGAALGLFLATPVQAESDFAFGAGNAASARLDFQIVIPRFLLFRVGTAGSTVDLVTFDFSAGGVDLGSGTPLAATSGGAVDVQLLTNATGSINIAASTGGPLSNGGTGTISFTEITTTVSAGNIPAPDLADGASAPVVFSDGAGDHSGTWTFQYANTGIPEEGTYGGAGVGTVTYTATLP